MQLQKDDVGVTISSKNISYNTLLSETGVAAREFLRALSLNVQLDQIQVEERIVNQLVQFDTLLNKVIDNQVDFRGARSVRSSKKYFSRNVIKFRC